MTKKETMKLLNYYSLTHREFIYKNNEKKHE